MRQVFVAALLFAGLTASAVADPLLPRLPEQTIDLAALKGRTYLQAMFGAGGIDAAIDADDARKVTLVGSTAFFDTLDRFDPQVRSFLAWTFDDDETGIVAIVDGLAGKVMDSQETRDAVIQLVKGYVDPDFRGLAASILSKLMVFTSGAGQLVLLDDDTYFYNVAYHDPATGSGRSYGVSEHRKLLDASDRYYLGSLDDYFGPNNPNVSGFYRTMFEILTASDPSGIGHLSPRGQTVMVDFATVYTAELERHEMVNFAPNNKPWQIDLAEVTLISAYGAKAKKVMADGHLIDGSAETYYRQSASGGGGLGSGRPDFMKLARAITSFEMQAGERPDLVQAIVDLTPMTDAHHLASVQGDVFRRVLLYLNRPEYQAAAQKNADAITDAVLALLTEVRIDASDITDYIL